MAIISFGGFAIPAEWLYIGLAVFIGLISTIIILIFRRGRGPKQGSPVEQRMAMVLPVDENGSLQVGKLIAGVTRTDKDLLIPDPDLIDEETGDPKIMTVPCEQVVPARLLDADKNLLEVWGVFDRGEYEAFSFASLTRLVRQRFDPLEADPRDVGRHYVGWGGRTGGLSQLIQSTTGKILVFTAAILIGYLLGIVTVALHVGHF